MLEILIISSFVSLVSTINPDAANPAEPKMAGTTTVQEPALPDLFPAFTAALTDCLDYFDNGNVAVFEDGSEIIEGVGSFSVFYPKMENPPKMQIAVSQRAGVLTCGGTGAAAPRADEIDTTARLKLNQIFAGQNMVEVAFPAPTRVWANCGAGDDRFVMMVPGAGDIVVLSANGNEPTAKVYCDTFGVK